MARDTRYGGARWRPAALIAGVIGMTALLLWVTGGWRWIAVDLSAVGLILLGVMFGGVRAHRRSGSPRIAHREEERRIQLEAERIQLEAEKLQVERRYQHRARFTGERPSFRVSIAYPTRLAKGYSSLLLVQIYPPEGRQRVKSKLEGKFGKRAPDETIDDTSVTPGIRVSISAECPKIEFLKPRQVIIQRSGASASFSAFPKADCRLGRHEAVLKIRDTEQGTDETFPFSLRVVDYAFDHVSRPLIGRVMSIAAGVGSATAFILGLLGQIDQVAGLTSGTAGVAVAAFLHVRVHRLYQKSMQPQVLGTIPGRVAGPGM